MLSVAAKYYLQDYVRNLNKPHRTQKFNYPNNINIEDVNKNDDNDNIADVGDDKEDDDRGKDG